MNELELKYTGKIAEDNGVILIREAFLDKTPVFVYEIIDTEGLTIESVFDVPNLNKYIDENYSRAEISAIYPVNNAQAKNIVSSSKKISNDFRNNLKNKEPFHTVAVVDNKILTRVYNVLKRLDFAPIKYFEIVNTFDDAIEAVAKWHSSKKN